MEIPCPTCQTLPHFIQSRLKKFYLSKDKYKQSYCNSVCNYYELTMPSCMENRVDPDQLFSIEFISGFILFLKRFKNGISKVRAKRSSLYIICRLVQVKFSLDSTLWPFTCSLANINFCYFHTSVRVVPR